MVELNQRVWMKQFLSVADVVHLDTLVKERWNISIPYKDRQLGQDKTLGMIFSIQLANAHQHAGGCQKPGDGSSHIQS